LDSLGGLEAPRIPRKSVYRRKRARGGRALSAIPSGIGNDGMHSHARGACEPTVPFQPTPIWESLWLYQCRGKAEGSVDNFDEGSLFAQDEPTGLCHDEIFTRFRI